MLSRSIINNVLNVFRPKRWVLTMVADKAGLDTITENPFDVEKVSIVGHVDEFALGKSLVGGKTFFTPRKYLGLAWKLLCSRHENIHALR